MAAGEISKTLAAARLAAIATGQVNLDDAALLERTVALLVDFTPEEQAEIGRRAIVLGADPAVVMALLNLVSVEVINVTGRAPRRDAFWWWLLGGLAVAGAGGYAAHRARRRRALRRG